MDSLHKGGGFKTIYMRRGAIEKKTISLLDNMLAPSKREGARKVENFDNSVIYIIIMVVHLSVRPFVRLCVSM